MLYAKLDSRPARTGFEVGSSMDTINKRTLVDMGVILLRTPLEPGVRVKKELYKPGRN